MRKTQREKNKLSEILELKNTKNMVLKFTLKTKDKITETKKTISDKCLRVK